MSQKIGGVQAHIIPAINMLICMCRIECQSYSLNTLRESNCDTAHYHKAIDKWLVSKL